MAENKIDKIDKFHEGMQVTFCGGDQKKYMTILYVGQTRFFGVEDGKEFACGLEGPWLIKEKVNGGK